MTDADIAEQFRLIHEKLDLLLAQTAPKERAKPKTTAIGINAYREKCKAEGKDMIPPDHAVLKYAKEHNIPSEFIKLTWREFVDRHQQPNSKRYSDWPKAFYNCVRGNWYKLWFVDGDEYKLTSAGLQANQKRGN